MIGPVLWLWSIRERFEFRYARISLHKTWRRSKRTPGPAENHAKLVFAFPCSVLDAQGFGAAWKHKSKQGQAQNGTGGNDRPSKVNDYARRISQFLILIRDLTRRISLRTSELALPNTVNPNETVPVNTGHCLRPLPFPQGMTVEWLACASTKAADRQKANIMLKKMTFSSNHFSISDGLAPIICARYPKNQLISLFAPIRS